MNHLNAIFFDLDGTLLDTAADLADALNLVLNHYNRKQVTFSKVRPTISEGARGIICNGFDISDDDQDYLHIRQQYLAAYQKRLCNKTDLFPGMRDVLDFLDKHNIIWGIVTNKPGWLTRPLLQHFNLMQRSHCLVTAETTPHRKPHPEPLQYACKLAGVAPTRAAYLGDSKIDVLAANSAGLYSLAATYGYHSEQDTPDTWPSKGIINQPLDLIRWVEKNQFKIP